MVSEAPRVPEAEGVNNIAIVHAPPAATEEPQVLFSVKSVGSAPLIAMPVMLTAAVPGLARVTVSDEQPMSTGQFPNVTLVGERLTTGADAVAVPVRLTLWGLPVALSVRVTAAVRVPL
jgi:hypothetical protein